MIGIFYRLSNQMVILHINPVTIITSLVCTYPLAYLIWFDNNILTTFLDVSLNCMLQFLGHKLNTWTLYLFLSSTYSNPPDIPAVFI